ncbi:MAG: TrkH family potassium uptake protein [Phycisphaerae bacterium]
MSVDLRIVCRHLGLLMGVLSLLILGVGAFSGIEHGLNISQASGEVSGLLLSAAGGFMLSFGLLAVRQKGRGTLGQREALLLVAMSWIVGAALAAAPFFIWGLLRDNAAEDAHNFDSGVNCYFEAMSGLTTTGATIVESLATLPRGLLLWRAMTHWLGGLGIVVLFVAVLPMLGVGGRRIYKVEAPGPTPEGVTPRIQDTARILWLIYTGLTAIEVVALRLCGMTWFDSVCHTFATLATGGFSTVDSSVAGFDSSAVHVVIILFMLLAGMNFGLFHRLIQRDYRNVVRDPELRLYLGVIVVATGLVMFSLLRSPPAGAPYGSWLLMLRDALFQVVSIQTTTGFCTADSDQWGFLAKATLLCLMFIGGCAGSTGGGIKVVRILIAAKVILAELEHAYRHHVVRATRIGRSPIDNDLKVGTLVYILGIVVLFCVGSGMIHLFEGDAAAGFTTSATAAAATLNNVGPGFARVGATQNYVWFSAPSKLVMSTLMLLGRLELFAIVVLFSPRFWRSE